MMFKALHPVSRRLHRAALFCATAVTFALCASARTWAQTIEADTFGIRAGVYGMFQFVQHNAKIMGIPGVPTCSPGFDGGTGTGFAGGALIQHRFSGVLAVQGRLGYSTSTGSLKAQENIGNALDNGQTVDVITEHAIEPTIGLLDIEPRVLIRPFAFPLVLSFGIQWGVMLTSDFAQQEEIVSPANVRFYDGLVRNRRSGEIPGTSGLHMAGVAGIGYDLPISKRMTLTPEISYHHGITKIIADSNWNMHQVRAGISLTFLISPPPKLPDSLAELSARVTAVKLSAEEESGTQMSKMKVEEFVAPQLRPLLNYMFFDEGSAEIPERYMRMSASEARSFDLSKLQNLDVLPTYYHMLNVIGWRLRQNPGSSVTLVGCNSDEGVERGKTDLSRNRAEAIRSYLKDVWGITDDRIKVEARNLPEKPSGSTADGMQENRRVEIRSSTPDILEPVFTVDTALTTDPAQIRFITEVASEVGVEQWKLVASQGDHELKAFVGNGTVPRTLDWNIQTDRPSIPRDSRQVDYRLEVTDSVRNHYVTPMGSIGVEQVTVKKKREEGLADKEINRFSLILFEYGKSDISDANRRIVEFIKGRIATNAKVLVTGHTDRAGDAAVNQRLSEDRARSTARALGVSNAEVKGLGESILLYNNDLPEGRFYCRVVNVVVETKIGE